MAVEKLATIRQWQRRRPRPRQCYRANEPLDHTAARLSECAVSMSAQGSPIRLLNLLAMPTDEVLFADFTADLANVVSQTKQQADACAIDELHVIQIEETVPVYRLCPNP